MSTIRARGHCISGCRTMEHVLSWLQSADYLPDARCECGAWLGLFGGLVSDIQTSGDTEQNTKPVESERADHAKRWIVTAPRLKWLYVRMQDAVEENMAVGAGERGNNGTGQRDLAADRKVRLEWRLGPVAPTAQE